MIVGKGVLESPCYESEGVAVLEALSLQSVWGFQSSKRSLTWPLPFCPASYLPASSSPHVPHLKVTFLQSASARDGPSPG